MCIPYTLTYRDFRLELFHVLDEFLGQFLDLLVVADVTQAQLVGVLHLELVDSRLQLKDHRVLYTDQQILANDCRKNSNDNNNSIVTVTIIINKAVVLTS